MVLSDETGGANGESGEVFFLFFCVLLVCPEDLAVVAVAHENDLRK